MRLSTLHQSIVYIKINMTAAIAAELGGGRIRGNPVLKTPEFGRNLDSGDSGFGHFFEKKKKGMD